MKNTNINCLTDFHKEIKVHIGRMKNVMTGVHHKLGATPSFQDFLRYVAGRFKFFNKNVHKNNPNKVTLKNHAFLYLRITQYMLEEPSKKNLCS